MSYWDSLPIYPNIARSTYHHQPTSTSECSSTWKVGAIMRFIAKRRRSSTMRFLQLSLHDRDPMDWTLSSSVSKQNDINRVSANASQQMFASYFDIKSRPCAKCSCLYDRNAQLPVGRSKKRAKQATGQYMDQWEAFHTACI